MLTCTTTIASDTIAWYFNNEPMLVGSGERGVLTLSPLRVDQGGWYTCAAANRFGRDEEDFLVVAGSKYNVLDIKFVRYAAHDSRLFCLFV